MRFDAAAYLENLSALAEDEIDPALGALALSAGLQPGLLTERYYNHLIKISNEVKVRFSTLIEAGAADNAEARLAALKHILSDAHGYRADDVTPSHLQNFSLTRTIDRGCGAPVMLCLLYVSAGRAQGWDVAVLDVPGRFIARIDLGAQRLIFDPAQGCRLLIAADLRAIVKDYLGPQAELSSSYFEPVPARSLLIRIQNIIKLRQIELEDYEAALASVELMRVIDPAEYRLLLDAGVLYARTKREGAAIEVLEDYIRKAPRDRDRHDAALLLQQLRENQEKPLS